jgi:hypothetical protein
MDDSDSKNKIFKTKQKETSRIVQGIITDVSYVLPASWLRCFIQNNHESDQIILGRGYRFLLYFRIILFVLCFAIEVFKN